MHVPGFVLPTAEPWGHELVVDDGLEGVRFPETVERGTASIGNISSFWATEAALLAMFERSGFKSTELVEPMHYSK
ncbi:MAG: hypothetical protein WKF43_10775 [Acidimicrobiales bacterium]